MMSSGQKGFTLIEVMVAVSIFAIVITVGIGSLMTVNAGYRQAQLQRKAIDNVAFAMETMAREIRVGGQYTLASSPTAASDIDSGSDNIFSFVSIDGDDVTYALDTVADAITVTIGNTTSELTSPNVEITSLEFVLEEVYSSAKQPYVTIYIAARATRSNQETDILLQTSVSQRRVNKF